MHSPSKEWSDIWDLFCVPFGAIGDCSFHSFLCSKDLEPFNVGLWEEQNIFFLFWFHWGVPQRWEGCGSPWGSARRGSSWCSLGLPGPAVPHSHTPSRRLNWTPAVRSHSGIQLHNLTHIQTNAHTLRSTTYLQQIVKTVIRHTHTYTHTHTHTHLHSKWTSCSKISQQSYVKVTHILWSARWQQVHVYTVSRTNTSIFDVNSLNASASDQTNLFQVHFWIRQIPEILHWHAHIIYKTRTYIT